MGATHRSSAHVLACAAFVAFASSCSLQGLAFRHDDRLAITHPQDGAVVTLPVAVEWRAEEFEVTGLDGTQRVDAGLFAVLVDQTAPPPGATLAWYARHDESCRRAVQCPDEEYLERRGVHQTTENSLRFEALPPVPSSVRRRELHAVTVILLDGTGRRIGETMARVEFEVRRDAG